MNTALPLTGIRILDFSRVLAGPFATMLLADMGADVLKIESLQGDDTRQWGPPWYGYGEDRQSAYFLSVNRNKRSLALNLKVDEGQSIARQLAAESHLLIENFKPGGMDSFGLGYATLSAANPSLVYASLTGYGQTGPYADQPGYDFVIQGQSGMMSITGPTDGEPYKLGVAISDVIAGLFAAVSMLGALRHAEASGQGQRLDIALFDTSIVALVNVVSNALVSHQPAARYGNAHPSIVPYQPFTASDRAFTVAVGNDRQFAALCRVADHPEWAADPRFATNPARVEHRDALIALLDPVFGQRTAGAWVGELLAAGVPAGPINTVSAVLDDPQVAARGLIHEVDLLGETLRLVGPAVGFSATPAAIYAPPPLHGQHTDTVLHERLGLSGGEIARLRADGVIG
ncbi:MAG: CoA transferase [Anaerolineae bacterium]|nr:CoA transferase [Anaerolineae bacterium]